MCDDFGKKLWQFLVKLKMHLCSHSSIDRYNDHWKSEFLQFGERMRTLRQMAVSYLVEIYRVFVDIQEFQRVYKGAYGS